MKLKTQLQNFKKLAFKFFKCVKKITTTFNDSEKEKNYSDVILACLFAFGKGGNFHLPQSPPRLDNVQLLRLVYHKEFPVHFKKRGSFTFTFLKSFLFPDLLLQFAYIYISKKK